MSSVKPIPAPDSASVGFWAAAREKRLVVQRCRNCASFQHPPLHACESCGSDDLGFEEVSGRGRVLSYVVCWGNPVPGFEAEPTVVLDVELVEQAGLRMQTNLLQAGSEDVQVGVPVIVTWEELAEGAVLPQFTIVHER